MLRKPDLGLLACALYLFSAAYLGGSADPSLFYMGNVLFHVLGGIALSVALAWCFGRIWKSQDLAGRVLLAATALGVLLGLILSWTGATRDFTPLLYAHIVVATAAAVGFALLPEPRRRLLAWIGAARPVSRLFLAGVHAGWLVPLALMVMSSDYNVRYRIENPVEAPLTMEEETAQPKGPFFPSAAETADGKLIPADFFMKSETCGTAGCHPDILKQWDASVHHLASFNNQWYRKSIEYMQDVAGVQASKWCGGCHDHSVLFSGMMDTPIRQIVHTPQANAGLGCVSCHSIVRVKNTLGNGGFVLEAPRLHDLATSSNPVIRAAHDYLTRVDPGPHRQLFLKPFHTTQNPEFCSACHKVHLDGPVNRYRWMRGFNEYDPWQGSGVSGQGARAFYYPEQFKTCTDCHMPLVRSQDAGNRGGMVHSHRFAAANTALPTAYENGQQLEAARSNLVNKQVRVDIFALGRGPAADGTGPATLQRGESLQLSTAFPEPEELGVLASAGAQNLPNFEMVGPIDVARPQVRPGESVRVDVVVRTLGLGHFFPGGTIDAFDVWVELKAEDEQGRVLLWSGKAADEGRGPVDPGAHVYRSFLLDGHGNPINKRNAWAARSLLYVRLIPPGAADTVHYRLQVPEDASGTIRLTARVNYRKFAWWNTQWSYGGVRDPLRARFELSPDFDDGYWVFNGDTSKVSGKLKQIPQLPCVTVAENRAELRVLPKGVPLPKESAVQRKEDRMRWNDYGIGLLLQGDLKGAQKAFTVVSEVEPGYADGWVNLARVQVQQGNPTEALGLLERAFALDPTLGKAHYFAGLALKTQGNYEEALQHFRRTLEKFPRDKVVRDQAGRVLFLQRRFDEAIKEFQEALRVDPEDLQAHYQLMLCYQGLGKTELAEREQKLYQRYKADEAAQAITGDYRRTHPDDNRERQQIHEHVSAELRTGNR